eukprot:TRINITY_DN19009_c0_g1_i1.p1 TRINITY_DN19009_c0_g1~~TRINITY_DN19009_c0_g1_i1.p1  ORF type:complete len:672 (-),score=90.25 TRINITY_DN19009_c0_g1_i1:34-2049(-)
MFGHGDCNERFSSVLQCGPNFIDIGKVAPSCSICTPGPEDEAPDIAPVASVFEEVVTEQLLPPDHLTYIFHHKGGARTPTSPSSVQERCESRDTSGSRRPTKHDRPEQPKTSRDASRDQMKQNSPEQPQADSPAAVDAASSKETVSCADGQESTPDRSSEGTTPVSSPQKEDHQDAPTNNTKVTKPVRSLSAKADKTATDCYRLLRDLIATVLLAPCTNSFDGWPLSALASHLMECKQALIAAPREKKEALQKFIFGNTQKTDTHRQCSVWLHEREFQEAVSGLRLSGEDAECRSDFWRETMRSEAFSSRKVKLQPGTSIIKLLVGAPGCQKAATDVHLHCLNPANPELFSCVLNFIQRFFRDCYRLVVSTPLSTKTGPAILSALAKLFPESNRIVQDILDLESSEYMIADATSAGVLKHTLRSRWDLKGILRRFGQTQANIFRYRPMYTFRVESQTRTGFVAFTMVESRGHRIELIFFTSRSGKLVWADLDGFPRMEGRDALEVPKLFGNSFHVRLTDLKVQLGGCGCFGSVDLPPLLLSMRAKQRPHPVIDVSCVEIGAFRMEWFFSPLFDAKLMRTLLVQHLSVSFQLLGDELHANAHFQMPKLGSLLKGVLMSMSSKLMDIVFGSASEDLPPILFAALGKDLAVLESTLPSTKHAQSAHIWSSASTV